MTLGVWGGGEEGRHTLCLHHIKVSFTGAFAALHPYKVGDREQELIKPDHRVAMPVGGGGRQVPWPPAQDVPAQKGKLVEASTLLPPRSSQYGRLPHTSLASQKTYRLNSTGFLWPHWSFKGT